MPKQISIPSTKVDQRLLMIRSFSFLVIGLFCIYIGAIILPPQIPTFPSKIARVPHLNGSIILLIITLWGIAIFTFIYALTNSNYHFELHSDVLIIVQKNIFAKKILFFNKQDLKTIKLDKTLAFPKEIEKLINYEINCLTIQKKQKEPIKFSFTANYHELKALKEVLSDFL